jgi:3-deoxy-D-manno-octulosonic-acid transferase
VNLSIRIVYQCLAHVYFIVSFPWYCWRMLSRRKYRAGLWQRLGGLPGRLKDMGKQRPIWIHSVSVGETRSIEPLIRELKALYPSLPIVISTVTDTGQKVAREIEGIDCAFYLPLDLFWCVRRAYSIIRPRALILVDTEIWPQMLQEASRRSVPVFVVNARISDRSWPRYRFFSWFFAPLLCRLTRVFAQTELDRDRLMELGVNSDRLGELGSSKYDAVAGFDPEMSRRWRERLGLGEAQFLIVAGSTFAGEEELCLAACASLPANRRLVLVPRHPERAPEVVKMLSKEGINPRLLSNMDDTPLASGDVLVVDEVGHLRDMYAAADLAIVGKSFCSHGGQNPIEPASQGVPTLFGPYMENQRLPVSLLLKEKGALQLKNPDALPEAVRRLYENEAVREQLGRNAQKAIDSQRGLSRRLAKEIMTLCPMPQITCAIASRLPWWHRLLYADTVLFKIIKFIYCILTIPAWAGYAAVMWMRRFSYRIGMRKTIALPRPVVSVGNLLAGGTGKTPLVRKLCQKLQERGIKPAVIMRGYGSGQQEPLLVSDGAQIKTDHAGDEAMLLAYVLPGVPVATCPQRERAAALILEHAEVDVFLLDDAFQHQRIKRDYNVVLIDCGRDHSLSNLMPWGILREPLSALIDSDIVCASHVAGNGELPEWLSGCLKTNSRECVVFSHRSTPPRRMGDGASPDDLEGPWVLVVGVGNPKGVIRSLCDAGISIETCHVFPDHHQFSEADFKAIRESSHEAKWITTAKDAIRMRSHMEQGNELADFLSKNVYVVDAEVEFSSDPTPLIEGIVEVIG